MERERSVPSQEFFTGFDVETRSLTWTIKGFPLVRTSTSMISSQKIEFTVGKSTGHPSKWAVSLKEQRPSDDNENKRWIGIFLKLVSPKATALGVSHSYAEIRYVVKDKEGDEIIDYDTLPLRIATAFNGYSTGYPDFIDLDDTNVCSEENLVVEITFKLYTPSQPKSTSSLDAIMEKFQGKFSEKLRNNLAGLLKNPGPCSEIKIRSNDKKEFTTIGGILAVRSEVFAAMLSSNMIEANSGVIELPDISSKALEILLNFLYTGELLPEWREGEVLVELTNAAGKYQLQELLQFLDATIGKVCRLDNVGALMLLARRLSLKVAEEELMMFVREEGTASADNFIQLLTTGLVRTDGEGVNEPMTKKAKLN